MKLLHIDSSILGHSSASRELGAAWVTNWRRQHPASDVRYRDLASDPIAHLSAESLAARATPVEQRSLDQQREAVADERTLEEFLASDVIVIGAPMYNFSVPSQLKAWIDRIAVAGRTFRYTTAGPEGLAQGKRVVIISSRGGIYSAGPAAGMDHQESYLRTVFGFLGITDIEFIRAEGLARGAEQRAIAMASARSAVDSDVRQAA
jgi:FMN-dependent NADH-azoreductase